MSKTVDELCDVFGQASGAEYERWLYDQRNDHVTLAAGPALAMRRAGIAAVIRALRDEMQFGDWTAWHRLNEILGDAGNEKVAGGCADGTVVQRQRYGENDRQSKDGAEVSPRHPDPATDLCPRCGYPAQDQCDSPDCNTVPAPIAGTSEWKGIMFVETAPAVCEWTSDATRGLDGLPHLGWNHPHGWTRGPKGNRKKCHHCGLPIKFTEAK